MSQRFLIMGDTRELAIASMLLYSDWSCRAACRKDPILARSVKSGLHRLNALRTCSAPSARRRYRPAIVPASAIDTAP